ncbi:MAG TPA: 16S rRNA (adenine(1518)-N(6)/adenine(1519)-N(6))-dimethyltransferase [Rhodospirillaceae bacterium]|nr:16S rRNA (adenine(1518)-N(6)/adenine(1519)-N(6))-dimethyltransferase [Candidatus Neomarinimicrobiota bacterium]HCX15004.1 16S rRNA (adenine(1518)-N(6)/adenine(1519)-N(6))-dimethyltransferase [Rhodospirillaceae bacterium]|tara:strand:+ start:64 stop:912 length:849 start_codon:yes stop_codon:yes gene_type:complete
MASPAPLTPLRNVIEQYGLTPNKSFGQHFILDTNLTNRIAREAGNLSIGTTVEIGPGPGGLTRSLLAAGAKVTAIERDNRFVRPLADLQAAYPNCLTIVPADAMAVEIPRLVPSPRRITANLPYNIATNLLLQWLKDATAFESFTLMFQREVASRIAALPGTKTYGRISVISQWQCDVEILFHINPRAFMPPPSVESTVIRLIPLPKPRFPASRTALEKVTAAAFSQRRKMLRRSLMPLISETKWESTESLCKFVNVDPTARAETLSIEQFCTLANALFNPP